MQELIVLTVVLFLYMSSLFSTALFLRNNGVADIGYGIGFLVLTLVAFFTQDAHTWISSALLALVTVWSLRLSTRIYRKNRGKPEDFRYRAWREAWGKTFYVRSYVQIYLLQGSIIALIVSPVVLALLMPHPGVTLLVVVGLCVSLLGILIEAISDAQLDRFLQDPQRESRIMTRGLWHYSRHPNYFGECLMWVGVGIATFTLQPFPFMSILSPLLITYLLLKVSGIPMLEKKWAGDPEWEVYKARTSSFIPLPPRS